MLKPNLPLNDGLDSRVRRWIEDNVAVGVPKKVELEHTFGGTANVEERVRHRLARRPESFRVISQSAAGSVYRPATATRNDRNFIYLKSSVAGLIVRLEVF